MIILCGSDISWGSDSSDSKHIAKILKAIKPDIVFFAGDLVYDSSSTGEHDIEKFLALLKVLDKRKIYAILLKGNHDDDYSNYQELSDGVKEMKYVKELSNEVIEIEGLKILGVPFGDEKRSAEYFKDKYDFVIAHSEFKKRIWLTKIKTRFVITGHFDNSLYKYLDTFYICLNMFPKYYAVINLDTNKGSVIYYKCGDTSGYFDTERIVGTIKNGTIDNKGLLFSINTDVYFKHLELLNSAKKIINTLDLTKQKELINTLVSEGISKEQISEYIGKKRLLYNYKS